MTRAGSCPLHFVQADERGGQLAFPGSGAPERALLFGSQHGEDVRPEKLEEIRLRPATLEAPLRVLAIERAELGKLAGAQLHVTQHSGGLGESVHGFSSVSTTEPED